MGCNILRKTNTIKLFSNSFTNILSLRFCVLIVVTYNILLKNAFFNGPILLLLFPLWKGGGPCVLFVYLPSFLEEEKNCKKL